MEHPHTRPLGDIQSSETKTIVIIGAGPAGLAALKAVLDSPQFNSGLWFPVVFELRSEVGGVWLPGSPSGPDIPPTPLYDSLTTNLPHPLMSYENFPFPPSTPVFPKAHVVETYLTSFAKRFNLRQYIKFNTSVVDVSYHPPSSNSHPVKDKLWSVTTSPSTITHADLVIVCTGHYAVPRYPDPKATPGLSKWLSEGKATHSMWYRHPAPSESGSASKTVLIVGAGPSGQDLTKDHLAAGYTVVHSTTTPPPPPAHPNDRLKSRPRVARYESVESGTVVFEDGSSETNISHCILATGYDYAYPFFSKSSFWKEGVFPPHIPPLPHSYIYNSGYSVFPLAQHIWPLLQTPSTAITTASTEPPATTATITPTVNTTLAFLGILSRVSPLPLVQIQARAVLAAFANPDILDLQREAEEIEARYSQLSLEYGGDVEKVYKGWHRFEPMEQYDYRDKLSERFVGAASLTPPWHREMYAKKDVMRRTWVALEKAGEAAEWVCGVGEGQDSDKEWEVLLRRLVDKGEGEKHI